MEKVVICQYEKHKSNLLNSVIDSIKCSQVKSFIWGAGYRGRELLHWLQSININITGFIDSDESKIGTIIDGVGVFSSNIVSGGSFVFISVYDCDDIIDSLKSKDINYCDSRETGIPVLYDKRFSDPDNIFFEIQNNLEEDMLGRPIPVLGKDRKFDYFYARADLYMYKILLDELRKNFNSNLLCYTKIKGKVVVFDRYNSISDEIIEFLRELGIKAGYVDNIYSDTLNISIDSIIDHNVLHYDNGYSFLSYMDVVCNISHCESYLENLADSGINVYLFRIPNYEELATKSLDEQYRHDNQVTGYSSLKNIQVKKVYGAEYELRSKGEIGGLTQRYNGNFSVLNDLQLPHTNVVAGTRVTVRQPIVYNNNVYLLGPCTIGGAFSSDNNTIPSILQQQLNREMLKLKVHNCGIIGGVRTYLKRLEQLELGRGDYVIIVDQFSRELLDDVSCKINKVDLLTAYDNRPQDIFFEDPCHMAALGNQYIGKIIYDEVSWNTTEEREVIQSTQYNTVVSKDVLDYINNTIGKRKRFFSGVIGSIVMNCNPFTLGHEFLIKKALTQCDSLYIFVVEENNSYYSFTERFEMVVSACGKYSNICVMPSGRAILSMDTLPEYFQKEQLQGVAIDPSYDVLVFATAVAPVLGISRRFVGEEPFDLITRQYNQSMKKILPVYGVEVVEIPRLEKNGMIVSASEVRRIEEQGDYENIKKYVPASTYKIMSRRWKM